MAPQGLLLALSCLLSAAEGPAPEAPQHQAQGQWPASLPAQLSFGLRVVDSYVDGGTTRVIVQSPQALVVGRQVYAGKQETPVTVDKLLSRSGGIYYYEASVPGQPHVAQGDVVRLEATKKPTLPESILRSMRAAYGAEQKGIGEITAAQGDRVMIDKGTLHEVHERDLYKIYDAAGRYKGSLEVRGIGDLQSSAIVTRDEASAGKSNVQPGDYAVFIGQRRLFGLGLSVGARAKRDDIMTSKDNSLGGGLLWSLTFHQGWGVEALFGYYDRSGRGVFASTLGNPVTTRRDILIERSAKFIAPVWLKKNFRYPSLVSPFVAGGAYWFSGRHLKRVSGTTFAIEQEEETIKKGLYPVIGLGVELFPTRFFRPRFEVRRFFAPRVIAVGDAFAAESTFYSVSVLTTW